MVTTEMDSLPVAQVANSNLVNPPVAQVVANPGRVVLIKDACIINTSRTTCSIPFSDKFQIQDIGYYSLTDAHWYFTVHSNDNEYHIESSDKNECETIRKTLVRLFMEHAGGSVVLA